MHTVGKLAAHSADVPGVSAESTAKQEVCLTDRGGGDELKAVGPWLGYDEVFFDCDSTLTAIEGVEELARFKGPDCVQSDMESTITQMTERAMGGDVPLEEVYAERLRLLRPTREDLQWIAMRYRERAVPDARELIAALNFLGKRVHIISGGLAEPVVAFGNWLEVPRDRIHAVRLEFDQLAGRWWEYFQGDPNPAERYLDFVPGPLSESRGKAAVIGQVRRKPGRALLVGDGVSDLLARPAVEIFVGFGGVAHRERVAAGADVYVAAPSLAPILPLVARAEEYERCRGTPHQAVFDQGLALIFEGDSDRVGVIFHHQGRKGSFYASYQAFHPRSDRGAA